MTRKSAIPANGFSLAATMSRPVAAADRRRRRPGESLLRCAFRRLCWCRDPAPTDRDEFVAGIPIFAQLANALADAGYLVVRYDERGAGQSGGRQESATIEEFAVDARAVVTYLDEAAGCRSEENLARRLRRRRLDCARRRRHASRRSPRSD